MSRAPTPPSSQPSMFSTEDSPARTSPWLDAALDWLEAGAPSSTSSSALPLQRALAGSSSKMSPAFVLLDSDAISAPSFEGWQNSGTGGRTEALTLNTPVWPNDGSVSFVGCLGDGAAPAKVLFESEGGGWDPPSRRGPWQGLAHTVTARAGSRHDASTDTFVVSGTLQSITGGRRHDPSETYVIEPVSPPLTSEGHDSSEDGTGRHVYVIQSKASENKRQNGLGVKVDGPAYTLDSGSQPAVYAPDVASPVTAGGAWAGRRQEDDANIIAILDGQNAAAVEQVGALGTGPAHGNRGFMLAYNRTNPHNLDERPVYHEDDKSGALNAGLWSNQGTLAVQPTMLRSAGSSVRRLTPLECERLQGFSDGWTCLCGARGVTMECTCPDAPRLRAIGNAVAVPVALWLARRLVAIHEKLAAV